jgi:nucleoside-diphosphate-sugar epimerase
MRVFVTGASGYIGTAVAEAFRRKGHWVAGLIRSEDKKRPLEAREIRTILGDMKNPTSYLPMARESDVWVHTAADWTGDFEGLDRLTVNTFLDLAKQSARNHTFIYTSGVWLYGNTGNNLVNESYAMEVPSVLKWRWDEEQKILQNSTAKLRGIVIRPGCIYGGRGGLTGSWFDSARRKGAAQLIGDGKNRWATIHIEDLADLYVRAAESRLRGELFNATDRSRFTVLEMAQAASRAAGTHDLTTSLSAEEARKTMGFLAEGLLLDQHVDSSKALQVLGWNPRFGGFAENAARYFQAWRAYQADKG